MAVDRAVERTIDVAVIGAGLSGLVCAQYLHQAGYKVVVVEKSRGLGGRLATRRLKNTCADHGVRALQVQGKLSEHLIQALLSAKVIHPWLEGSEYTTLQAEGNSALTTCTQENLLSSGQIYTAQAGLTAVAKFLATGLEIWRGQRVQALDATTLWHLTLEPNGTDPQPPLLARAVVLAIPAPQAATLLEPLVDKGLPKLLVQQVQSVQFDPCITAIATYPPEKQAASAQLTWQAKPFPNAADLDWISLEHTKRAAEMPVLVAQSTAEFAEHYLEAPDLQPIGQKLLHAAANLADWLAFPVELQVHRWRYAFARQALLEPCLATALPLPLVCSGDWCGGKQIENALESGLAAAGQISRLIEYSTGIATTAITTDSKRWFHQWMHQSSAS